MADVKIGSKVFQLDEDADTQQKQRKIYEQYKNSSSEAELEAKLLSVPIPEKRYYVSVEAIEKRYLKCKETFKQSGTEDNEGYCERFKARLIKENEIVENLEKTETAKSATPDPVQASSNKLSKPVDVLNFQEKPKTNQKEVLKKVAEDLIPIESSIKAGGTQHLTYEKDIHISVGSVANTFPHIRKDASGEFRPKSISIEGKGAFVKHSPVSYTEEVENSRFPCGTYSINAANKLDLTSGAGGTNVTSGGNMKVGSNGRTLITAREEMNVSSGNGNVNVRAAHNVSIKGDSLTLETPNQVVVNANLGVAKNAIINGCAFVDGELYVNHITCPAEVQYTGGGIGAFGQLMTSAGVNGDVKGAGGTTVIAYADVSFIKKLLETPLRDSLGNVHRYTWNGPDKVPVLVLSDSGTNLASSAGNGGVKSNPEYSIYVLPHSHPFNNVPLTFTDGNESLRSKAAILNSGNVGTASNIEHGYKSIGKTLPGTI